MTLTPGGLSRISVRNLFEKIIRAPARSPRSENIILALSLFVASLTYIAEVSNTYLPGRWLVGCCGKFFLWTPMGCSLVLVVASLTFRLKTAWSFIVTSALALYVFIFFSNVAVQRWLDYSPVDKGYALQQSLMPVYRPSATLLGLWLMAVGMRHLFTRNQPPPTPKRF